MPSKITGIKFYIPVDPLPDKSHQRPGGTELWPMRVDQLLDFPTFFIVFLTS
jgi:hypothetical protein